MQDDITAEEAIGLIEGEQDEDIEQQGADGAVFLGGSGEAEAAWRARSGQ